MKNIKLKYKKYSPEIKKRIKKLKKSYKKNKPKVKKHSRRISRNIDNYYAESSRQIRDFRIKI